MMILVKAINEEVSDKLIKPLTEAKYLNADNVSRYRCIMRIFFEHYEKLKYWLYQEEVYEEMIKDHFVFLFMRFHMELMGRSRLRWMGNFMGLIHWLRIR